jgi:hypothetical protein
MSSAALRFSWKRPTKGVELVEPPGLQLSGKRPEFAPARPEKAEDLERVRRGWLVLAPAQGASAKWKEYAPEAAELETLNRELARLRVSRPEYLARFANRWGPFGVAHAEVALPREGSPVVYVEPLPTVTLAVLELQLALELHLDKRLTARLRKRLVQEFDIQVVRGKVEAKSLGRRKTWRLELHAPAGAVLPFTPTHPEPRLFWRRKKDGLLLSLDELEAPTEAEARDAWLRRMVTTRLRTWELPDEETFGWRVSSPLGAGWRLLADALVDGLKARLCDHCGRPFLPMASNKRRHTNPPRFCSDSCRVSAHKKSKAPKGRRGKKT